MTNTIPYQEEIKKAKEHQKRWLLTCLVIILAVVLLPNLSLFRDASQNAMTWSPDKLTVTDPDGTVTELPFDTVTGVSLVEGVSPGKCISGGVEDRCRYGLWETEALGKCRFLTNITVDSCIILETDNIPWIINFESQENTKALYESVLETLTSGGYLD